MVDNWSKLVVYDHYLVVKKDGKRAEYKYSQTHLCVCLGTYCCVDQQEISAPVVCVTHTELLKDLSITH